ARGAPPQERPSWIHVSCESSIGAATAAATTTAAATATAAAVATAKPAAARRALARLVDGQRTATEIAAVQVADRAVGVLGASHLDESEAAWPAGVAVGDELDLHHVPAVLSEQLANLLLVSAEGKVADIQSGAHAGTPGSPAGAEPGPGPRT